MIGKYVGKVNQLLYLTNDKKTGLYLYTEGQYGNGNWSVAGAPRVAERIDALADPEAKVDRDTYGMKQAGIRPREQVLDPGRGLVLRWLTNYVLYVSTIIQISG